MPAAFSLTHAQIALFALGSILVAVANVPFIHASGWGEVVATIGGVLLGILKTGPGQVSVSQLPFEDQQRLQGSEPPSPK